MWNVLPYTVFDSGTLDGFKGGSQPLVASMSCVLFSFFDAQVRVGLRNQFINNFVFPHGAVPLV